MTVRKVQTKRPVASFISCTFMDIDIITITIIVVVPPCCVIDLTKHKYTFRFLHDSKLKPLPGWDSQWTHTLRWAHTCPHRQARKLKLRYGWRERKRKRRRAAFVCEENHFAPGIDLCLVIFLISVCKNMAASFFFPFS